MVCKAVSSSMVPTGGRRLCRESTPDLWQTFGTPVIAADRPGPVRWATDQRGGYRRCRLPGLSGGGSRPPGARRGRATVAVTGVAIRFSLLGDIQVRVDGGPI